MWPLWWPKFNWRSNLFIFYVFLSPPVSGRIAGANLKVLHFLDNLSFSHGNLLFGDFEHVEQIWLRAWYFAEIIFCYSDTPCSCSGHWFICSGYRAKVAKSVRGFIFRQNSMLMLESPFHYWHCSVLRGSLNSETILFECFPKTVKLL